MERVSDGYAIRDIAHMYIRQASLCYKRKLAALRKGPINMANKKMSTAELVGISHFSRNGLMTKRYGEVKNEY